MNARFGLGPCGFWRKKMKKLALAVALAAAASTATAGSLSEPVVEAPVVMEETQSSSAGAWLPILMILIVAAAVTAD